MTRLDEGGFASPGRILIAATGYIQNTGRTPDTVSEDMITYGRRLGQATHSLRRHPPCESPSPKASRRPPSYPLDEAGNRREGFEVKPTRGYVILDLGPEYRTLWYEVVIP